MCTVLSKPCYTVLQQVGAEWRTTLRCFSKIIPQVIKIAVASPWRLGQYSPVFTGRGPCSVFLVFCEFPSGWRYAATQHAHNLKNMCKIEWLMAWSYLLRNFVSGILYPSPRGTESEGLSWCCSAVGPHKTYWPKLLFEQFEGCIHSIFQQWPLIDSPHISHQPTFLIHPKNFSL